jgi:hypothetical protein
MSAGREAVLHIGVEKTGTTGLQSFLDSQRARLAAEGVGYADFLGPTSQFHLATYAVDPTPPQDIHRWVGAQDAAGISTFRKHVERTFIREMPRFPRWIFSSEHLSSRVRSPKELGRLAHLLQQYFDRVTIVCYLRRQDCMIPASYSTAIKNGHTEPLDIELACSDMGRYDFRALIRRWREAFGESALELRIYREGETSPGWLERDFHSIAVPDTSLDWSALRPPQNRTLDAPSLEFLRLLNARIPAWRPDGGPNQGRGRLVAALERLSTPGAPFRLKTEEADRVMQVFAESNACVLKEFEPKERVAFLQRPSPRPTSPPQTDAALFARLLDQLLPNLYVTPDEPTESTLDTGRQ